MAWPSTCPTANLPGWNPTEQREAVPCFTVTSPEVGQRSRRLRWLSVATSAVGGVFFFVTGLWAMIAPERFFDAAAKFEPYNQHFVQDVGAFQIGLGAVLLLATLPTLVDRLAVGLLGVGVGSAAHVVSHVVGRDLGGKPETDIPVFAVLTVLLLAGGLLRFRDRAR